MTATNKYPNAVVRAAVGAMFFITGLCFASWASRIANIQQNLSLSDAALGGVLFALPVGLMVSLPLSGWATAKFGSRNVLILALTAYGFLLIGLGSAVHVYQLVLCLILFGLAGNAVNISVNTQAVATERLYVKPIMASFHGLWSLAGFTGAAIGTFMIGSGISPAPHFIIIAVVTIVTVVICVKYLHNDHSAAGKSPSFLLPHKSLVMLGLIAFCSMICEGAMFDWSIIYFKKIVHAEKAWVAAGYTAFMATMALTRFVADRLVSRFGLKLILQASGLLTTAGLAIAVMLPNLYTAIFGFLLVGAGVSSVVPLVYSAAGKSQVMQPGAAITAVSTISFIGFLIGPPVIGFIAGAFSLRISFTFIAMLGLCVTALSSRAKLT